MFAPGWLSVWLELHGVPAGTELSSWEDVVKSGLVLLVGRRRGAGQPVRPQGEERRVRDTVFKPCTASAAERRGSVERLVSILTG